MLAKRNSVGYSLEEIDRGKYERNVKKYKAKTGRHQRRLESRTAPPRLQRSGMLSDAISD